MSYGVAFHLTFFIGHFKLQEIYLHILSHALLHKHDAHDMVW